MVLDKYSGILKQILGNPEAAARWGWGLALGHRGEGGLGVEPGPGCRTLGLGLCPRRQPFNSVHVHRAPTVCQVLGTAQGQSPQTLTGPSRGGGLHEEEARGS